MEQKEMLEFVKGFRAEDASLQKKEKYYQYLDELCEAEEVEALKIKAWGYYGGNELFECNWVESERYLLRLVEVAEEPYACNALGYIYYYGRTTDGVPDYERAFKYFSVAALYGIYEAMYKVADLCLKGKGIPMRCLQGAKNIIEWLYYDQVLPLFTDGKFDSPFADVAARMGRLRLAEAKEAAENKRKEFKAQTKENGEDVELPKIIPLFDTAYEFFKLAEYALELRAPYDQYGDTAVMAGVRQGLEEARTSLSYSDTPTAELEYEAAIKALYSLVNYDLVCVKFKTKGKGGTIKVKLVHEERGGFHKPLISLPRVDYCRFTDKLVLTVDKLKVQKKYKGKKLYCNSFYEHGGVLEFEDISGGIIKIKVEGLAIKRELSPQDLTEYKMVSVTFNEGGKEYDYLYNLKEPIFPGDKVIVEGYQGETAVTVTKVFTVPGYQLKLPLKRYKAVNSIVIKPK